MNTNPCGKKRIFLIAHKVVSVITLIFFTAGTVFALPAGQQVVNGQASFITQSNNLTVTNTPNAIINWQGFSINNNEAVRFLQQNSASSVLNRVIGQDPSRILGLLQSNGRVFLINPNGILFGQGARIDVNGLFASTLAISNQDFLAGKFNFSAGAIAGSIQNQGTITTPSGGKVYLIAPDIENSGIINTPQGEVLLAAGHSVQLVDSLNPDIAVVVSAPANKAVNLGQIVAQSGKVGIYGGLISQKGSINADSAVSEGGRIFLRATKAIELADTSVISADGTKGGQIIVMTAEDGQISGTLTARGLLSAQGDGSSGSGGFIETSAANVDLNGINVRTRGGNWLIDPVDFTIAVGNGTQTSSGIGAETLSTNLGSGSVSITTDSSTSGNGDIFVNGAVLWTSSYGLTLNATGNIGINASITGTSGTLTLNAPGATTQTAPISVAGLEILGLGNYTLTNANNLIGTLAGNVASVNLVNNQTLTIGTVNTLGLTATGDINLTATGLSSQDGIIVNSPLTSTAGNITLTGTGGNGGNVTGTAGGMTGGDATGGTGGRGIYVSYSANIEAAGSTSTITLNGYGGYGGMATGGAGGTSGGGYGGGNAYGGAGGAGIYVDSPAYIAAPVSTSTSAITLNGIGGIGGTATGGIDGGAGGGGDGYGGYGGYGIEVFGQIDTSAGSGAITVIGSGGGGGTATGGNSNTGYPGGNAGGGYGGHGIEVFGKIDTSAGSGAITVIGSGGSGGIGTGGTGSYPGSVFEGTGGDGVVVNSSGLVTSGTGAIDIIGTGGNGINVGYGGYGVVIRGEVTSTGTGAISITGYGGNSASVGGDGVDVYGLVTSTGGAIAITGTGGNGTSDYGGDGVYIGGFAMDGLPSSVVPITTGGGALNIAGTGGGGIMGGGNGIYTYFTGLDSGAGAMTLTGKGGGIAEGLYFDTGTLIGGNWILTTGYAPSAPQSGNITLIADSSGPSSIAIVDNDGSGSYFPIVQGAAGTLTLQPLNPATTIGLAGGLGEFNLGAEALNAITGFSNIVIGHPDGTGFIDVGASGYLNPLNGIETLYWTIPISANLTLRNPGENSEGMHLGGPLTLGNEVNQRNLTLNTTGLVTQSATISETGAILLGETTFTVNVMTTGMKVGMTVSGPGIPLGTTIVGISCPEGCTITISDTATGSSTSALFYASYPISTAGLELLGEGGYFLLTSPFNNVVTLAGGTAASPIGGVAFNNGNSPLTIGIVNSTNTGLTASDFVAINTGSGGLTYDLLMPANKITAGVMSNLNGELSESCFGGTINCWDGTGPSWNNSANWSLGHVPGSIGYESETVRIVTADSTQPSISVPDASVASIISTADLSTGGESTFTISSGDSRFLRSLTIGNTGTLEIASGATANISQLNLSNYATVMGSGSLNVTRDYSVSDGTSSLDSSFYNLSLTRMGNFTIAVPLTATNNLRLNAINGTLTINQPLTATNVTLKAGYDVNGDSGLTTQAAAGYITATGLELLGGSAGYTLTSSGNSITTLAGNVAGVDFSQETNIKIGTVNNTTGITAGSDVTLTSNSGSITFAAAQDTGINTPTGTVRLFAEAGAVVNSGSDPNIVADGLVIVADHGIGSVFLALATQVNRLNATNITSGDIALTNTAAPLTIIGVSQSGGGAVLVNNTGGITANGDIVSSNSTVSSGAYGKAGGISLTSTGTISASGIINAAGRDAGIDLIGGAGGDITLTANTGISVGNAIYGYGGSGYGGSGLAGTAGGNGGTITLNSTSGAISVGALKVNGGAGVTGGIGGTGGAGGKVDIYGVSGISFGQIDAYGGVGGTGGTGTTTGGTGGYGGYGGEIKIVTTSSDSVTFGGSLSASGGNGGMGGYGSTTGGTGGYGNTGGKVYISAPSLSINQSISANSGYGGYGGWGESGSSGNHGDYFGHTGKIELIATAGALTLSAPLTAGGMSYGSVDEGIYLSAVNGSITQSGSAGPIDSIGPLVATAKTGITLTSASSSYFDFFNSTSGDINATMFGNWSGSGPHIKRTINQGGNVSLLHNGNFNGYALTFTGPIESSGAVEVSVPISGLTIFTISTPGTVSLTAGGSITNSVATEPAIIASTLTLTAKNGIGSTGAPLRTQVSYLTATNAVGSPVGSGDINILNTGTLATSGLINNLGGEVTIVAKSPLTIGAGGVSASGNISLTAAASGSGDNLVINGDVTSSGGNIVLTAGNSITVAPSATLSANGTITQTANLNQTPAPTPTPTPPTLAGCIANPALSGCSAILPTLATCTATPTTAGCTVVLPSLATCTTTPTTPGCTAVLPTVATCTATPTAPGCSAVLPTLATCTTTPTAPGCTAVLPTIATCTATPTAPGCSAVLPTLATCTTTPTTPGCSAVLPTLATCTANPTAPGCSAVLPTLATCTASPTAPGCSAILPTLATCTANPTAPGCSAVLPTVAVCTATPTIPGCTAVLPTLATCTVNPTAPGCSAILPTLATCTANPTAPGCSAVLPTLATCIATPTAPGCTAVLPTPANCTTNPTAPECTPVLPTLATCTITPTAPGCSAVLPTLATCTATPTVPGCTAVLPSVASCTANPTAPGCSVVVLPSDSSAPLVIEAAENTIVALKKSDGTAIATVEVKSDSDKKDDEEEKKKKNQGGEQPSDGTKKDDDTKKYCN
jgi:filamentous hemagglutinin family protein